MDHFDYPINNTVSARIYYSRAGRQVYLVDNKTGSELARIDLVDGVDFGHFLSIISNEGDNDGS